MYWSDVSDLSRAWMTLMGDFSPTAQPEKKMLKGRINDPFLEDDRTYYDSGELRELAAACTEVADWLDKRAELHKAGG